RKEGAGVPLDLVGMQEMRADAEQRQGPQQDAQELDVKPFFHTRVTVAEFARIPFLIMTRVTVAEFARIPFLIMTRVTVAEFARIPFLIMTEFLRIPLHGDVHDVAGSDVGE